MSLTSLLLAAAIGQVAAPPSDIGLTAAAPAPAAQAAPKSAGIDDFGLSQATASENSRVEWTAFQATVTSYLEEPAPPAPPPPVPTAGAPGEMGLSPVVPPVSQPGVVGQACACDNAYVDGLYADAYCEDDGCRCKGWLSRLCGKCGCKSCGIHSTCDLIPHYAYFPKHHGYYYFRPYNYTTALAQQQTVIRLGGDPRFPYSVHLLDNLFANIPEPAPKTSTHVRQTGPVLPTLEDLLEPRPAP